MGATHSPPAADCRHVWSDLDGGLVECIGCRLVVTALHADLIDRADTPIVIVPAWEVA